MLKSKCNIELVNTQLHCILCHIIEICNWTMYLEQYIVDTLTLDVPSINHN